MDKGRAGEIYNVCSGNAIAISDILENYINFSTFKSIEIKPDSTKMRPSDFPVYYGQGRKIFEEVGWTP